MSQTSRVEYRIARTRLAPLSFRSSRISALPPYSVVAYEPLEIVDVALFDSENLADTSRMPAAAARWISDKV